MSGDGCLRKFSYGPPHFILPDGSEIRCDFDKWTWRADSRSPWYPVSTDIAFGILRAWGAPDLQREQR
jgi:hypothetical protein